jgi:hypothetical protein
MGEIDSYLKLAESIQSAVEKQQYVFLAVMGIIFGVQLLKIILASRYPSIKDNAGHYAALGGAAVGVGMSLVTNGDPIQGATGGFLVGNAASGMYSSVVGPGKRILQYVYGGVKNLFIGKLAVIPAVILGIIAIIIVFMKVFSRTPRDKRKIILNDFDQAMEKSKGDNPSTKDLEQWFTQNL